MAQVPAPNLNYAGTDEPRAAAVLVTNNFNTGGVIVYNNTIRPAPDAFVTVPGGSTGTAAYPIYG